MLFRSECEKTTKNKKVDSSNNAYFLSLRALLRKAWQSIQKYTNPLESTFEKTAQKAQEIQTLQKADSSDTPIFATAKTMDCHATATQCLAMTAKMRILAPQKVSGRSSSVLLPAHSHA